MCTPSLGPVYMVSGTRDNPPPPPRDNFTERLYGVVSCKAVPSSTLVSLLRQPGKLHIRQNGGLRKQFEPSHLG